MYVGGLNIITEIDETVLSRRGIIRSPTGCDESRIDTIWIIGLIDNSNARNFYLSRIIDRRIPTITECIGNIILPGSIVYTDGHPSYPRIATNLNLSHHVVNHSIGFVSNEGIHTNNIECFWSHLKTSMRKENGVKRVNIDDWISQYTFRRRYLVGCSREAFCDIYIEICKYYFN